MSDAGVAALKKKSKRYLVRDPEMPRHFVMVHPSGKKTYSVVVHSGGKQRWVSIGQAEQMPIAEARNKARETVAKLQRGEIDKIEPVKDGTFGAAAESWFSRHVVGNGLRSRAENRRMLDRYLLPLWKDQPIASIGKLAINTRLDDIEDKHGVTQAARVQSAITSITRWHEDRSEDYTAPRVRSRYKNSAHARERILDDEELRAVWLACDDMDVMGALVRLLLLTGQRLSKVRTMRHDDIKNGIWHIATEKREKGNAGTLPLPPLALAVIRAQRRFVGNSYVLPGRDDSPYGGRTGDLTRRKEQLDKRSGVTGWTLHDLRRTARSLMSRAGVLPHISERVLGHVIGGVEGVYDRHSYEREKGEALAKLALLIDSIVHPQAKVVPIRGRAKARVGQQPETV